MTQSMRFIIAATVADKVTNFTIMATAIITVATIKIVVID